MHGDKYIVNFELKITGADEEEALLRCQSQPNTDPAICFANIFCSGNDCSTKPEIGDSSYWGKTSEIAVQRCQADSRSILKSVLPMQDVLENNVLQMMDKQGVLLVLLQCKQSNVVHLPHNLMLLNVS